MLENILLEENIDRITMPENLALGLMVAKQHEKCASIGCNFDYFGFAFGQSPFPVPRPLSRALENSAEKSGYADAEGIFELRKAAAHFNARHFGLDPDPKRIIIGPGNNEEEELAFVKNFAPQMVKSAGAVYDFVAAVKSGKVDFI